MYSWLLFISLSFAEEQPSAKPVKAELSSEEQAVLKKMLKGIPAPGKLKTKHSIDPKEHKQKLEKRLLGPYEKKPKPQPSIKAPSLGSWWRPVFVVFFFCLLCLVLPFTRIFRGRFQRSASSIATTSTTAPPPPPSQQIQPPSQPSLPPPVQSQSPKTKKAIFGSYQLLAIVDRYSKGILFRARHFLPSWAEAQKGDVLLHILNTDPTQDPKIFERFLKHANYGKFPQHPNLARIIDVITDQNRIGVVMELVDGIILERFIPINGLDLVVVKCILSPIAELIDLLHEQKQAHLRIQSDCIKICKDGTPILLDFGFPPEGIQNPHIDLFDIGLLSYQLLCGELPWDENCSDYEIIAMKTLGTMTKLIEKQPNIPEIVNHAVMKMLSPKPENRYPSCQAFLQAWEEPLPIPEEEDFEREEDSEEIDLPIVEVEEMDFFEDKLEEGHKTGSVSLEKTKENTADPTEKNEDENTKKVQTGEKEEQITD